MTRVDRLARSIRDLQNIVHEVTTRGDNRGLIAFEVVSAADPDPTDSVLPEMTVEVIDAVTDDGDGACEGDLTLLDDDQAPPPISSSEPSP